MQTRAIACWGIAALTLAGALGTGALNALAGDAGDEWLTVLPWAAATLASCGVGLVLAVRRDDNPIGWLLLANGLVLVSHGIASGYADYAVVAKPGALPGGEWAVLWTERGWPALFACITAIAYLFPDGRLPSSRWRPVAIAVAIAFGGLIVTALLSSEKYSDEFARVSSPLPEASESVIGGPFLLFGLGAFAGLLGAAAAVWRRWRRSSGVERQQLKWLAYASMLIPAAVTISMVESWVTGGEGAATEIGTIAVLIGIPLAVGVAVMRYRLYEIDRLINRTLVYVTLTVALAAVFAVVALSLGVAIGSGSTLATAAATLAVALIFGPLRARLQVVVDRRFDRARYEGLRTIERFLAELRAGRAAPEATGEVIAQALADPTLELFFWLPDVGLHVDAAGRVAVDLATNGRAVTPVKRGALKLATVIHDEALAERPDLLENVIEAAGLAIEIARLRVEVSRRLAEVEKSRARIVTVGFEERRRLERDLHDGAQQRLVSIGLALRHVQGQLPASSSTAAQLDATVGELTDAIEELRELARGVRPAGLDDGLSPALRELASRSPLRIRVEATDERFEETLETAAYFVASEALTNAAKHARASQITVNAVRRNGHLVVRVHDDGIGGALAAHGSGLTGMTDRVAALGGSLAIESPPGGGTLITAELPCAS